jgi:hypothetical protein
LIRKSSRATAEGRNHALGYYIAANPAHLGAARWLPKLLLILGASKYFKSLGNLLLAQRKPERRQPKEVRHGFVTVYDCFQIRVGIAQVRISRARTLVPVRNLADREKSLNRYSPVGSERHHHHIKINNLHSRAMLETDKWEL